VAERKFEDRWENFRDLVEHLFLEPGRGSHEVDVVWYPATDAYETENEFVIRMDLSAVRRDQIQITRHGHILDVKGIRGDLAPGGRKTFHKMEIAMGPFARSIQIPDRFESSETSATYVDGVLEIRLQATPDSGPREITIEVD